LISRVSERIVQPSLLVTEGALGTETTFLLYLKEAGFFPNINPSNGRLLEKGRFVVNSKLSYCCRFPW